MSQTRKESKKYEEKKQGKKRKKDSLKILIFALLLIILVLSLVMIIRLSQNKPLFSIGESYYNMRIAQALKQDFFLIKDPVQGTFYEPNLYHYLLAFLMIMFPPVIISLLFPLLLGVLSGFLFFKLLVLIGIKYKQAAYSLIILSVTPIFITLFTGLYLSGFIIFLSLLTLVLTLNNKKIWQMLGILLFLLLALTSLTGFLITVIIIFFLCLALKKNLKALFFAILIPVLVIVSLSLFSDYTPRLLGFHSFAFKNILSLLKATLGFDLFLLLLFFTGFFIIWVRDEQNRLFHLVTPGFIIFSFFNNTARVFTSFIITTYCVVAITYLYKRRWQLKIIRIGTLLLVLCSLVFSITNQVNLLVNSQPDKEMQNALIFLKDLGKGRVLTSENYGFLVEYYSEKEVLLDSNSFVLPNYLDLKNDTNILFRTARLKEAEPLIKEYGVHYILITPSMKEELWEEREQGLWFLMKHSESFIKKYEQRGIEIWEYTGVGV